MKLDFENETITFEGGTECMLGCVVFGAGLAVLALMIIDLVN